MSDDLDQIRDPATAHLLYQMQYPGNAEAAQKKFNEWRYNRVVQALQKRPFYLPVQIELPAAASNSPVAESTTPVNFPMIITGAITDGEDRNIRYYINRNRQSLIGFGRQSDLRLSLAAVAGETVAAGGFSGVQKMASPIGLTELDYLTLEMYQETSPGATELITTCFTGIRPFLPHFSESYLSPESAALVKRWIDFRPVPITTYDVVKVDFDASGFAEVSETPQDDQPYMILGFRVNTPGMSFCTISFGYDDFRGFSPDPIPIWAVAAEYNNPLTPWQMLPSGPLYMDPFRTLKMRFFNTINGTVFATDGNLEILKTSV